MKICTLTVGNIWDSETEVFTGESHEEAQENANPYIHETIARLKKEYTDECDKDEVFTVSEHMTFKMNEEDADWFYSEY